MKRYYFSEQEQSLLEGLQTPLAVFQLVDRQVITIAVSEGFCDLLGSESFEQAYAAMNQDAFTFVHPDDLARVENAVGKFIKEGGALESIYRLKDRYGYRMLHAMGKHVFPKADVRLAYVWYMDEGAYIEKGNGSVLNQSLTNALHEESILKASFYDSLTGLPNLSHFFDLAEMGKVALRKRNESGAMLYIDLNGMKYFNYKHGFAEGDRLLQAFSKLLSRLFGAENCGHVGADRFTAYTKEAGVEEALDRLFEEASQLNGGKSLPVRVGIHPTRLEDVPVSVAYDRAKIACDAIRKTDSSSFHYYSKELHDYVKKSQYIITNIDRAISEQWIQVYYQPIVRAIHGRTCDMEALARWIDPTEGFLSPADFIPFLEDAGLIYKLDLYVLEQVLIKMNRVTSDGLFVIPHSINLSRSDFDACDIVEEIRKRVDAAGIERNKISIEITESVIGSDFDFMKAQVERFQKLGFPVWMDDFGSGYSSLDVLQQIHFDLIKFDMGFMRKLDEDNDGKIILTELMKMATSLGVDTICEGVETKEQAHFLQEIGCSKLQGYYYSRPVPYEEVLDRRKKGHPLLAENPAEASYYASMSRVNLFDLAMIANSDENIFQNSFNTVPMGIIEIKGDSARFARSNQSYRDFIKRFYGLDLSAMDAVFRPFSSSFMRHIIKTCCEQGTRSFYDEKMPDGSVVHSFARQIAVNPLNGNMAVAVAVLSVSDPDEATTYGDIARALAADYYNLYVIDLDTNQFIEYTSPVGGQEMAVERHGEDFFESARRDTLTRIYAEDRAPFLALFTKERVLQDLDAQGVFTTTYRLIDSGTPMYVNMKITRMHGGNRIILGVSIIDAHMKQLEEEKKLLQEKKSLSRIAALAPNFLVLYTVDPETGHYVQYNPSNQFEHFGLAKQGEDFFTDVRLDAPKAIAPEDMERHLRVLTKENMMREIQRQGFFVHSYRMIMDGKRVPVKLKATLAEEDGRETILLGVTNDSEAYGKQLEADYRKASSAAAVYNHIAHALARGYTDLFYVNMETDELIEFHTDDERGVLTEARRGADFFEGCERDARLYVHPDDQAAFIRAMNRDSLSAALAENRVFELTYRRIKGGAPFYVRMKATRMEDDPRIIVIAVSDIDELMRQRLAEKPTSF